MGELFNQSRKKCSFVNLQIYHSRITNVSLRNNFFKSATIKFERDKVMKNILEGESGVRYER